MANASGVRLRRLARQIGSLPLAIVLLLSIAGVLGWGTFYEMRFGAVSVQRYIYRSWWFQVMLGFLSLNLLVAAWARYPWKRPHVPFLLAHLGIVLVLLGGIAGRIWGLDGRMIIAEGHAQRVIELPQKVVAVQNPATNQTQAFPVEFDARVWNHSPNARFDVALAGRHVGLTVDQYLPNAKLEDQVVDDGQQHNPAVHVVLSSGDSEEKQAWLFARDPQQMALQWHQSHVVLIESDASPRFAQLLRSSTLSARDRGVVTLEFPHRQLRREISVPQDFSRPLRIEGTPYTLIFKEYLPDFVMTEQGVQNRSDQPNNPALAFILSGPEGADTYLLFGQNPQLEDIHQQSRMILAHATYTRSPQVVLPPDSLLVVRHPSGALSCVLTNHEGQPLLEPLEIGQRARQPWAGYDFTVTESYARATRAQVATNRDNQVKAEAIHVVAREGSTTQSGWLRHGESATLALEGGPLRLGYQEAEQMLPLSIKLLSFRKLDYPGTQMPAGFESDVQLSDMERGVVLMRQISMNHPLKYREYAFYQSSYVTSPATATVLSVRSNAGTPLVYAGFLVIGVGLVAMFTRQGRRSPRLA